MQGFDYSIFTLSVDLFVFSASIIVGMLSPDLHGYGWFSYSLLDFISLAKTLFLCYHVSSLLLFISFCLPEICCYFLLAVGSFLALLE